jgi:hypothetical protein
MMHPESKRPRCRIPANRRRNRYQLIEGAAGYVVDPPLAGVRTEVDPASLQQVESIPRADRYGRSGLGTALAMLQRGEFIDRDQLVDILAANAGRELPPALVRYRAALERGEIPMKRGRRPLTELDHTYIDVTKLEVRDLQARLERRKARYGRDFGFPKLRTATWWAATPYELAVNMVREKWYPHLSAARVRNMLSAHGRSTGRRAPPN